MLLIYHLLLELSSACATLPSCRQSDWRFLFGERIRRQKHGRMRDPGAQATIRLIHQSNGNTQHLLKTFHKSKHFEEESRALGCVSGVRGFIRAECTIPERSAIVMEYADRGDLTNVSYPLPASSLPQITRTLIEAIHELHAKGFIHHDIKPANVVLKDTFEAKIIDLGLSKQIGQASKGRGTPITMAPEQLLTSLGVEPNSAIDWWSLGVTLFYLHCRQNNPSQRQGDRRCYPYELEREDGQVTRLNPNLEPARSFDKHARRLITRLLTMDPRRRDFDGERAKKLLDSPYLNWK